MALFSNASELCCDGYLKKKKLVQSDAISLLDTYFICFEQG